MTRPTSSAASIATPLLLAMILHLPTAPRALAARPGGSSEATAPPSRPRSNTRKFVPVAIFDLDDTLFHSGSRTRAILEHYAHTRRPELLPAIRRLPFTALPYSFEAAARRIGIHDAATVADAKAYWARRFFGDQWPIVDVPLSGAVEYVRGLHRKGVRIVYLTGRDEPGMGAGTRQALRDAGFPLERGSERAHLFMKPRFGQDDAEFKSRAVEEIRALGPVFATYENEPGNANILLAAFPDATHFLVGDRHRPGAPDPDPAVRRVEGYADLSLPRTIP